MVIVVTGAVAIAGTVGVAGLVIVAGCGVEEHAHKIVPASIVATIKRMGRILIPRLSWMSLNKNNIIAVEVRYQAGALMSLLATKPYLVNLPNDVFTGVRHERITLS
jgi:hypothetical protein